MAAKTSNTRQQIHLAVLIDADNAPAAIVEGLFEEIAKYGVASVKRIYGDWTKPNLGSWKKVLLDYSIQPIQQFAYTSGKNATDSSLIIDAMDLLYTRRFDGFCLVSSDSDFTRLAARIREEGLTVYGFGEQKTPSPFVSACDKFIYTEILRADAPKSSQEPPSNGDKAPALAPVEKSEEEAKAPDKNAEVKAQKVPVDFIAKVLSDIADDEDDWVHLGELGSNISKLRPAFDPRLYGFKKLSDLIKSQPKRFELEARGTTSTGGKALYARSLKPSK
ncbi:NYN domain-containing protein [Stutzerimonas zhaodongensis]|uniref:NYN domain-containing protein n=1 Tax=Stutzerimonas zhaodongensis TaxID=1176257 RepID=A0A3M2HKN4_9GAMM|nr:NYN domain-containing protein [Stutzerimonas zhaodongensis]MCQ2030189.1 NYN domain-containing protein [Stutzerimonas zhaodongensis]MCQ4318365.1 NYN domain-containing protein [Stutzerimonas zhaodongensis]RMH87939.1 NYN domain-containing protein [Stutzerimonas zhaodongensis]